MDITKFNKELKVKVSLAKSFEKRNEINSAIKLWLEISEMALQFSKSRNIEARYKYMLLNRTKGIIEHIKSLKSGQIEKNLFEEEDFDHPEDIRDENFPKDGETKVVVPSEDQLKEELPKESEEGKIDEIVEDSYVKNLPDGFKELKTSSDFTIVTPHDEEYVKKHLAQYRDSSKLNQQNENKIRADRFEKPFDEGVLICFACGYDKNSKNAKVCKNCGIKLN
ncbi:MAG: hypothetical protein ACW986_05295 [Promethearchaeota archaeon]|jgi:hypothetical protein